MKFLNSFLKSFAPNFLTNQGASWAMYKAYKKNPKAVGELVACSPKVAKEITALIEPQHSPKKILEVGAGSGAITNAIIEKMNDDDQLDLIEINRDLCAILKVRFGHMKNVSIHCKNILQWKPKYRYDYVVSTLPFNSFSPKILRNVMNHLIDLAKENAPFGFVEFKWLSHLRMLALRGAEKKDFQKVRELIKSFNENFYLYRKDVYLNFPPLIVYLLKITK